MKKDNISTINEPINLSKILHNILEVIFIVDANGFITYKSSNVEKLFGWKYQELIGCHLSENIHTEDLALVLHHFESILKQPLAESSFECRYKCKNGSHKWIKIKAVNLFHDEEVKGVLGSYHDITAQKEAEIAISGQEKLYHALFQNLTSSSSLYKVLLNDNGEPFDFRFIAVNPAYEKNLDRSNAELVNKTLLEIFPETDQDLLKILKEVFLTGEPLRIESYISEIDKYFRLVVYRPQNDLIAIIGTDITDKKLADNALKESEERGRLFIENTPLPVAMFDKNMCYLAASTRWLIDYKLCDQVLIGRSHYEVFPEITDKWKDDHQRVLKGEIYKNDADKFVRSDGTVQWLRYELMPWHHSNGVIGGLIMFTEDITSKILANEALRLSEQKLQSLFKVVPAGIGLIINQHLAEVNPKACLMTGYSKEELTGRNFSILFPTLDEYNRVSSIIYENNTDNAAVEIETVWKRKDHTLLNIYLASTPINQGDFSNGFTFTALDITGQKEIENELIDAKEKAEESNRLKTAFLQNMSHEIRTPLNAILGFSDLLDNTERSINEQKEYINIIKNSSHQLLSILEDVFTVSSIQTNQAILNVKTFSLAQLIDDVFEIYKSQSKNAEVQFIMTKSTPNNEDLISTDKTKLVQIINNLVNNALKFTAKGTVEFGYQAKHDYYEFYVKDTGIGIHPDQHEIIFERFAQANINIHVNFGGSGLGLSIVKGYINLLKGKIWVESELNKGATFHFIIPRSIQNTEQTKT